MRSLPQNGAAMSLLPPEDAARLGASDFASLLGLSEYGGQVALWARMAHGVQQDIGLAGSEGHIAEAYNRALYRNRTGFELRGPASWTHPLYPWLRCNPDDAALTPDGRRNVELKRSQSYEGWGPDGSDAVPVGYWLQVQVQNGVGLANDALEERTSDVSALICGGLRIYSVGFQSEVYERCLALGDRFVTDFVMPKRFPEGGAFAMLERDAQALQALYPRETALEPLQWDALAPDAQHLVRRWLEANGARKAWEAQEKALKGSVQALLREVPGLVLPPELGRRIDFKASAEGEETDWEEVAGVLGHLVGPEEYKTLRAVNTTKKSTRPLVAR